MNALRVGLPAVFPAVFLLVALLAHGDTGEIRVTVHGIRDDVGVLSYLLFDGDGDFPQGRHTAVVGGELPIDGETMHFVIPDVPYGRYAISILHDEDENTEMRTGFFGAPREGYGFSRDAPLRLGPPRFDDAVFEVYGPVHRERIAVRYGV